MCEKRLLLLITRKRKPGSAAMQLRTDQGETKLGCNWDPARTAAGTDVLALQQLAAPTRCTLTLGPAVHSGHLAPKHSDGNGEGCTRGHTAAGSRTARPERQPASRRGRAVPVSWDVPSNYTRVYALSSFKTRHRKDRPRPVGDSGERIIGRTHFRIWLWHD